MSRLVGRGGFNLVAPAKASPVAGGVGGVGTDLGDDAVGEANDARTAEEIGAGAAAALPARDRAAVGVTACVDRAAGFGGVDTPGVRRPAVIWLGPGAPVPALSPTPAIEACSPPPSASDGAVVRLAVDDWRAGDRTPLHANRAVSTMPTTTTAAAAPYKARETGACGRRLGGGSRLAGAG